ncbi:extracellular solute-binding protein [Celeribacter sp.]|uniref:extracellular solute-binding protein n=1 Tax=Celeribacter sp. TaxID=1890673 RepID=UPI003A8F0C1D
MVEARRYGVAGILAASLAFYAQPMVAQDADVTIASWYSNWGVVKYPEPFEHLDYVNPDAPKGGEISIWSMGDFDSFNPYARDGVAAPLPSIYYESILTATADDPYGAYCYLCTTMEYPDSRDWVIFNLRDDVRFWDGTIMDAEDVAFSFNLFIEQGIAEYRTAVESYIDHVEVLGPNKIKFTFTQEAPRRDVVTFAGGTVVFSKDWFEETGTRLDKRSDTPFMATGPYQLDSFEYSRQLVLKRDPDHWGKDHPLNVGQNNFDTIRVESFADSAAAFEAFKSGEYTFRIENSSKEWATSYNFPSFSDGYVVKEEVADGSIGSAQSFVFNLDDPKWQDPRVREAIGLMFNFEWSNETLFYGLYERVNSFWENSDLEATGTPSKGELALLRPLVDEGLLPESILTEEAVMAPVSGARALDRGNLRKAAALLDEAGWTVGSDGMRAKDGQALDLVVLGYSPAFDRIINPFVENMRALGIDASLERVDTSQYVERRRSGDFDLVNHSFAMGFEPGSGLRQWFSSSTADDSSRNLMRLRSPAIDRLVETAITTETLEELTVAVHALDRALRAEAFWIPQWYKDVHTVAYFDVFAHPDDEIMPPYALGYLDFWWYDAEKAEALKAAGVLK